MTDRQKNTIIGLIHYKQLARYSKSHWNTISDDEADKIIKNGFLTLPGSINMIKPDTRCELQSILEFRNLKLPKKTLDNISENEAQNLIALFTKNNTEEKYYIKKRNDLEYATDKQILFINKMMIQGFISHVKTKNMKKITARKLIYAILKQRNLK